jgi:hypothetical protein
MDWTDISYLNKGNAIQQKAFDCLSSLHIFDLLQEFKPTLTRTIPIRINIDSSDLDIACQYTDANVLEKKIKAKFQNQKNFSCTQKEKSGHWIVLASFQYMDFEIQIYGSQLPVTEQNSYRHMLIEHRILELLGHNFRKEIIQLKQKGLKTEPAFALLLELKGDPFKALLELENDSDKEIISLYQLSTEN